MLDLPQMLPAVLYLAAHIVKGSLLSGVITTHQITTVLVKENRKQDTKQNTTNDDAEEASKCRKLEMIPA